jgi:MarR family transcriptional regulator, 2-MHQ and catechol-resistance regulon repressor
MADLKSEIAQSSPFASGEEEAILNLLRTSDCLERAFHLKTRRWGVTATQYNVLRILRGAQPVGLPCAAIGERMIAAEPDITRLLRRLKGLKLIQQQRDRRDRRVVLTHITSDGLKLLRAMDPVIRRLPKELLAHMSAAEVTQLTRLVELARRQCCNARAHEGPPHSAKAE